MATPHAPSILLIEDEPAIADTVVYALETEGFRTHWCNTGAAAWELLGKESVDLLLLDIGLPDSNGFDLCRDIRRHYPRLPLIFLTARGGEIDRIVGLEIGADDYVVKPFSPRELTARVRAVLRRSGDSDNLQDTNAPPITQDCAESPQAFRLDEAACRISYFGTLLDLSRYEYRLLRLLVQHPQRIYSRDLLLDLAWERDADSLDRTVDTHIKTLRAKLRAIRPDLNPIKTHRGLGYSLSLEP